jgi:hypothetical protein
MVGKTNEKTERANAPISWVGNLDKRLDRYVLVLRLNPKMIKAIKELSVETADTGETQLQYSDGYKTRRRAPVRRVISSVMALHNRCGVLWDYDKVKGEDVKDANKRELYFDNVVQMQQFVDGVGGEGSGQAMQELADAIINASVQLKFTMKGKVVVKAKETAQAQSQEQVAQG